MRNNEGEELAKAALGLQRLKMTFLAKEMLRAIFVLIPNSSFQHAPIFSSQKQRMYVLIIMVKL